MKERNILWLASFPKSGNTWIASVLDAVGCRYGYSDGTYDAYNLETRGKDPQPCECLDDKVVARPSSILKTHSQFNARGLPHRFPSVAPVTAAYIHIFRNPLDVLLSYIGFTRLEYRLNAEVPHYRTRLFCDLLGFSAPIDYESWRKTSLDEIPRENLDHALDVFSGNGLAIPTLTPMCGSWIDHYRSWVGETATLPGVSLRYEDCISHPEEFAKLARLLKFSRERIVEGAISANASIETKAMGGRERDRIFFNKRKAFYFRNYFSKRVIEHFLNRHERAMIETGYFDALIKATGSGNDK